MSLSGQSGEPACPLAPRAPLPPGVPYKQQQFAAFTWERGVLDLPERELAALAKRIGAQVEQIRQEQ